MATIGRVDGGASEGAHTGGRAACWGEAAYTTTDGSGGQMTGYSIDVNSSITDPETYDVGAYPDDGGEPDDAADSLEWCVDGAVGTGADAESDTGLTGDTLAANTMYWIAVWCSGAWNYAYDATNPTNVHCYDWAGAGGLLSGWDQAGDTWLTRRPVWQITYGGGAPPSIAPTAALYGPLVGSLGGPI